MHFEVCMGRTSLRGRVVARGESGKGAVLVLHTRFAGFEMHISIAGFRFAQQNEIGAQDDIRG